QQATINTGQTDYIAEATVSGMGSSAYPGIMVRWSSTNTFYWVEFSGSNRWALIRMINGTRSNLYSATAAISGGQAKLAISVREVGSSTEIAININDTLAYQTTDSTANRPMGTHVGLRYGSTSGSVLTQPYDDLVVVAHEG